MLILSKKDNSVLIMKHSLWIQNYYIKIMYFYFMTICVLCYNNVFKLVCKQRSRMHCLICKRYQYNAKLLVLLPTTLYRPSIMCFGCSFSLKRSIISNKWSCCLQREFAHNIQANCVVYILYHQIKEVFFNFYRI